MARQITVQILGDAQNFTKATQDASKAGSGLEKTLTHLSVIGATALVGMGVVAVKMAADFQTSTEQLVTGAGESEKAIDSVRAGILKLAPVVGVGPGGLSAGLYNIESAGFHGAQGLLVLKAAAEGAKVGNADMATVADAVTTALNAYKLPATSAVDVTNALVEAVASGKMHMQDLAASLGAVVPAASVAGVSLTEVLAAISTMTAQGTPAADATTYLRQTILQLSNPTARAALEMKALGLSALDVSKHLGERGLTGTLTLLTDAIEKKMGPQGTVLIENLKKVAHNTTDFQKVLANLPPTQQTYIAALANMVGGTKSMQAALELTGPNMATFKANVEAIDKSASSASKDVQGWSNIQGSFNLQMEKLVATVQSLAIELATKLLPMVTAVAAWLTANLVPAVTALGDHMNIILPILGGVIGSLVLFKATMAAIAIGQFIALVVHLGAAFLVTAGEEGILNAVLALNPIGLVIIAVAGLIAGLILLVTHWKQVVTWAEAVYGRLLKIPVVGKLIAVYAGIMSVAFGVLVDIVKVAVAWFGKLFDIVVKVAQAIANSPVGKAIGAASGGISGTVGNIGKILGFAEGTDYVPYTGLAMVHQGEQIIPAGHRSSGGGNVYITIAQGAYIDGPSVDRLANIIAQRLQYATGR